VRSDERSVADAVISMSRSRTISSISPDSFANPEDHVTTGEGWCARIQERQSWKRWRHYCSLMPNAFFSAIDCFWGKGVLLWLAEAQWWLPLLGYRGILLPFRVLVVSSGFTCSQRCAAQRISLMFRKDLRGVCY